MKQFLSVILAVVLVLAVGASVVNGTMAGFFDVEVSTENMMCAGTRTLELSGGPIVVEHAWPSQWFSEEYILLNTGSLDATAYIHFPAVDDPEGHWQGIRCEEAGTIKGMVFDGSGYRIAVGTEPVGAGVATTEPELTAEEGGIVGEKADGTAVIVPGLGVDTCNLADFIEVKVYFENVLKVNGMLSDVACTDWVLGPIPAYEGEGTVPGGGWGSYFKYQLGSGPIEVSLIGGQMYSTGMVTISDDGTNLYVEYNTSSTGWKLSETHVYAGIVPPPKLAPGQFKKWGGAQHDPISPPSETDSYILPFSQFGATPDTTEIYLAVHAIVCHPEYKCETAWGKGVYRKVRIELHFPDIDEDDLGYHYFDENIPAEAKWDHWPTNAYMGDRCIFDIVFKLWRP